jgi:hypothetical protein
MCTCAMLGLLLGAPGHSGDSPSIFPSELARTAAAYNIRIISNSEFPVHTAHGLIDGGKADSSDVAQYARMFCEEFSLYPVDLVKRSRLQRVVLCRCLSFAGQRWNAVPDFEHDTLYLDVSRSGFAEKYYRLVIHHDFFHIIDYRSGNMLSTSNRWRSLNEPSFTYGTGGPDAQTNASSGVLTDKYPGFLNYYSTTSVAEDKAEVFANMIVNGDYVRERTKKDEILRAKVGRIRKENADFCSEMNLRFWERATTVDRSPKKTRFFQGLFDVLPQKETSDEKQCPNVRK